MLTNNCKSTSYREKENFAYLNCVHFSSCWPVSLAIAILVVNWTLNGTVKVDLDSQENVSFAIWIFFVLL